MPIGFNDIPFWEIIIRLTAAMMLSGLVGLEREAKEKPAGIRTYALVGLGAASFMLFSLFIVERWAGAGGVTLDLIRAVSGVVGGVGFLGAGAIIHGQGNVKGLTTAAGIWVVAAVGLACGAGAYVIAATTVGLAYIILLLLHLLKCRLSPDRDDCQQKKQQPDSS